ncbi:MAG: PucR family transcriptional regulator [Candidatus Coproplasma sp.]
MSQLINKNRDKLSLNKVVEELTRAQREELLDGCELKNFVKIFEDEDMMNTLDCLFENNLNVSQASRALYMHRNTLIYRLNKITEITGLDPRDFSDAVTFIILHKLYCAK